MEQIENQTNQPTQTGKRGGFRVGAGRPKGSRTRPQFADYVTEEQAIAVVSKLVEDALSGKVDAQKHFIDHVFGKAVQPSELSGVEGSPLFFQIAREIIEKNDLNTETGGNSEG